MLKLMTVVGTRPELIRLSRTIALCDKFCNHRLVHTGQNYDYELNQVFFEDLNIRKPDAFLNSAGRGPAETIGNVIIRIDEVLEAEKPEALLILGDTNSALAAIAAKRRKIPIFHMEAGNRCFDARVPEEINRRIVDHTSDINITYSQIARENLLREGLPPDQVICAGSPMREVLDHYSTRIDQSPVLSELGLVPEQYFLVSAHREENVDDPARMAAFLTMLDALANRFGIPVLVSTHPRTRKRIESMGMQSDSKVVFHKPFGFFDYVHLQKNAKAVLSDSGTITEEASICNFPALNIRDAHERLEGFEEGAVMFVGMNVERIMQALTILTEQPRGDDRVTPIVHDYSPTIVSEKILRIIYSYTDFVNRKVWRKDSCTGSV